MRVGLLMRNSIYLNLFRSPTYIVFLFGRIISEFGDILFAMATTWYVLDTTESPVQTALVLLFPMVVNTIFGSHLATIADLLNKKKVMIFSDIARALIVLGIAILIYINHANPFVIYLANILLSILGIMFNSSEQSVLPNILKNPNESLSAANGLMQSISQTVHLIGYPLAGIIVAYLKTHTIIMMDSLSFLLSAIALIPITIPFKKYDKKVNIREFVKEGMLGFIHIYRLTIFRNIAIFAAIINLFISSLNLVVLTFCKEILKTGSSTYGYVQTATMLGAILGGVLTGKLANKFKMWQWLLFCSPVSGLFLILAASFHFSILLVFSMFVTMLMMTLFNTPVLTKLQLSTPDEIRGRVFTSFGIFVNVVNPLGLLLGSYITASWGSHIMLVIIGIVYILAGVVGALMPSLKNEISQNEISNNVIY